MQHLSSPVTVRVGESTYKLSNEALQREPGSKLARLATTDDGDVFTRDHDGRPFIDRDGPAFRHVANYLRHGSVTPNLPHDVLATLRRDADYYGLPGLQRAVAQQPDLPNSQPVAAYLAASQRMVDDPADGWHMFKSALRQDPHMFGARKFAPRAHTMRAALDHTSLAVFNLAQGSLLVHLAAWETNIDDGDRVGAYGDAAMTFLREAAQALPDWPDVHERLAHAMLLVTNKELRAPSPATSSDSDDDSSGVEIAVAKQPCLTPHNGESASVYEAQEQQWLPAAPPQRRDTRLSSPLSQPPLAAFALKHAELAYRLDPNNENIVTLRKRCLEHLLHAPEPPADCAEAVRAYKDDASSANLDVLLRAVVSLQQEKGTQCAEDPAWENFGLKMARNGELVPARSGKGRQRWWSKETPMYFSDSESE